VFLTHDEQRSAVRPHAWVDHDYVNRVDGEVPVGLGDGHRAVKDVERVDAVADVYDLRIRVLLEDDTLHRADEMVRRTEVSGQSDEPLFRQRKPLSEG